MLPKLPELVGSRVGEYEITARLGAGGMGVVFEGRHPVIGKRVAVKVLHPALMGDEGLVQRFIDEARAVNQIGHRGIVDIFAFGELPSGAHYLVMELLRGKDFDQLLQQQGSFGAVDALGWVEEVLDALSAAHRAGVVHRDIKPSNLFLVAPEQGEPYVKLLDFGVAKLLHRSVGADPLTVAGARVGTPFYMAPEQVLGREVGPPADLYAVGCVLFELLTGRRVFESDAPAEILEMHATRPPRAPSSLAPGVPPSLDRLVLSALAKAPDARPSSAAEFCQQCQRARAALEASGQSKRLSLADDWDVPTRISGELPTQRAVVLPGPAATREATPTARASTTAPAAVASAAEVERTGAGAEGSGAGAATSAVVPPPLERAPGPGGAGWASAGLGLGLAGIALIWAAWPAGTSPQTLPDSGEAAVPLDDAGPVASLTPVSGAATDHRSRSPALAGDAGTDAAADAGPAPAPGPPQPAGEQAATSPRDAGRPRVQPGRAPGLAERLRKRLGEVERQLKATEARRHEPDALARRQLQLVKEDAARTASDTERAKVLRDLEELSMQLSRL